MGLKPKQVIGYWPTSTMFANSVGFPVLQFCAINGTLEKMSGASVVRMPEVPGTFTIRAFGRSSHPVRNGSYLFYGSGISGADHPGDL